MPRMKNPGRLFEAEIMPLIKAVTSHAWKIADTRNFHRTYATGKMIGPKVRADFISITRGLEEPVPPLMVIWWECKSVTSEKSLTRYDLKRNVFTAEHQVVWAQTCFVDFANLTRQYYLFGNRIERGKHYALLVPGIEMYKLMEAGAVSISWEELEAIAHCRLDKGSAQDYATIENIEKMMYALYGTKDMTKVHYVERYNYR